VENFIDYFKYFRTKLLKSFISYSTVPQKFKPAIHYLKLLDIKVPSFFLVDYLSTRALSVDPDKPLTLETSFARYWKRQKTLEVGHRGYGVSTTKFSAVRENTIHSLNHAAENGADFVEFDVQVCYGFFNYCKFLIKHA
jgi:hypothetical protein